MVDLEPFTERLSEASLERRRRSQLRRAEHFVRGPIPVEWIARANAVSPTAAIVGVALWFKAGCESKYRIRAGLSLWSRFRLSRFQANRGLTALESVGLIRVERHRGRNPVVTILRKSQGRKARSA